jgi:predicted nucleic acid-binding protein
MKYVIDCSTAFKWVVAEADTPKAAHLRDDYLNAVHDLLVPELFPTEIGNSLLVAERRGPIKAGEGARLLADVLMTLPALHDTLLILARAYEIAHAHRETVYDCLYVALAERETCEFITADDKLVKNLQAAFPFVVPLASLP